MLLILQLSLLLLIISPSTANDNHRHILWNAENKIPPIWIQGKRADHDNVVTFHVALAESNQNVINLLDDISDPRNKNYGHYLSTNDLRSLFAAPLAVQQRVESFFRGASCNNVVGSSLKCMAKVPLVEHLFETKMYSFTHQLSSKTIVRHTGTLSIPISLKNDIEFITGLGQFFHFEGKHAKAHGFTTSNTVATTSSSSSCTGSTGQNCYVVPSTIRTLYNVSGSIASGSSKTSVGVAEFSGNFAISDADLKTFGTQMDSKTTLVINNRGGQPNSAKQQVSEEAQLDIEYTSGLGDGVTNWVWNQEHWMFALCADLQNSSAKNRPSVISMSYAWSEQSQCSGTTGANCQQLGVNSSMYVKRTNQEFAKVGLLGITMLSASGDSGCHGRTEGVCIFQKDMKPAYPASSPYVTSVGGTMLHSGSVSTTAIEPVCQSGGDLSGKCAGNGVEVVSSTGPAGGAISSGGGFAAYSDMPDYQKIVVGRYLDNTTAMSFAGGKGTLFNAAGRGYPDISALAHKVYIVMNGKTSSVDGTSAASPTVAGLMGLINTQRLAASRPLLGFVNPLLYQAHNSTNGAAFNDITNGNNACTEEGCWCKTGFEATAGWDAATGLGTLNVGNMMEAIKDMDRKRDAL
jgi:tripeptidyl-peptidase I